MSENMNVNAPMVANPVPAPVAPIAAPAASASGAPAAPAAPAGAPAPDIWADPGLAKFKRGNDIDNAALAKSYLELQGKLGAPAPAAPAAPATDHVAAFNAAALAAQTELLTSGAISPESRAKLIAMGAPADALDFMEHGAKAVPQLFLHQLTTEFGGPEQFAKMQQWAQNALPEQDLRAIGEALASGKLETALPFARGLAARYQAAISEPGHQVSGRANQGVAVDPIKSAVELHNLMADPRYSPESVKHDPAFHADVWRRAEAGQRLGYVLT